MILSKADYKHYLERDRAALRRGNVRPPILFIKDPIWKYMRRLRKTEYLVNCKRGWLHKPRVLWSRYRLKCLRLKLGFSIGLNSVGPGLRITHEGSIIIGKDARIGSDLRVGVGIIVGMKRRDESPVIGDHCVLESGSKIFGKIVLADYTHVGANAVVNRSFTEPGMIIAGVPARVVKANPDYPESLRAEGKAPLDREPTQEESRRRRSARRRKPHAPGPTP